MVLEVRDVAEVWPAEVLVVDKDQVYFARTMRAVATHATFQVWPYDEDTSLKLVGVTQSVTLHCVHCHADKPRNTARVDRYRQEYC